MVPLKLTSKYLVIINKIKLKINTDENNKYIGICENNKYIELRFFIYYLMRNNKINIIFILLKYI